MALQLQNVFVVLLLLQSPAASSYRGLAACVRPLVKLLADYPPTFEHCMKPHKVLVAFVACRALLHMQAPSLQYVSW